MEKTILELVDKKGEVNSLDLVKELNEEHTVIVGQLKSLESDNLLTISNKEKKKWVLTKDG